MNQNKNSEKTKEKIEEKDKANIADEKGSEESKSEFENLKGEFKKTQELLLRTAAEYDNFRKRTEREKSMIYNDATAAAILEILPLSDSLDAAVTSSESMSEEYKKGIELIYNQMQKVMQKFKVESFGNIGEEFDPNIHNAISHIEDESEDKNIISQVFQKGYKIGDRIIRHAVVQVTN